MEDYNIILPVRENPEIGSGSGSSSDSGDNVQKNAKKCVDFSNVDCSKFRSTAEFCASYETISEDPFAERIKYEKDLQNKYKLPEIKLFLKSEGRVDEANIIQSLNDDLANSVRNSWGFRRKDWVLRPDMGQYNEYQRLYVGDNQLNKFGEVSGEYGRLFYTYASDHAYLEFFKELQYLVTWNLSKPQAWTIVQDASKKYVDLEPGTLHYAFDELFFVKKKEQQRKEMVPFYTQLWKEVVHDKRDGVEVLKEIVDKDGDVYPTFKIFIEDELNKYSDSLQPLYILKLIKNFITASPEVEELSQNYGQLIHKYFLDNEPEAPLLSTYAAYVEKKMKVAEKLGLI